MPGPTYGLSRKEVKKARKVVRKTGAAPAAASQQVSSSRTRTIKSYPSGTQRRIRRRLRERTSAKSILDAIGPQIPDGLSKSQFKVLNTIVKTGNEMGASPKEILSAVETGLVESNLQNLPGGDGTSVGWRQEISTYGSQAERMNVKRGAQRYFSETKDFGRGAGMTAGELAANVQRPREDLRGKYAEREAEAQRILSQMRPNTPEARAARRKLRSATNDLVGLDIIKPKSKKTRNSGPLPGPYAGSRNMVRQIVGSRVKGDKEYGHSSGGMHDPANPNAYAQDINVSSGNPSENEPAYDQATVSRIVKNLRKLGADIPADFQMGQNWEGSVRGYQIELLTAPHGSGPHIHIGAQWGTSGGASSVSGTSGGVFDFSAPSGSPFDTKPLGNRKLTPAERRIKRRRNRVLYGDLPTSFDSTVPTLSVPSSTIKAPKLDI